LVSDRSGLQSCRARADPARPDGQGGHSPTDPDTSTPTREQQEFTVSYRDLYLYISRKPYSLLPSPFETIFFILPVICQVLLITHPFLSLIFSFLHSFYPFNFIFHFSLLFLLSVFSLPRFIVSSQNKIYRYWRGGGGECINMYRI
jgi:hypothetical protein